MAAKLVYLYQDLHDIPDSGLLFAAPTDIRSVDNKGNPHPNAQLSPLIYPVHPDQYPALRSWIGSTPVLVYDGPCPLCNRVVKFLLWADTKQRLLYTTQQMEAGQALLHYYDLRQANGDGALNQAIQHTLTDEVWLATDDRLYTGADAALQTLISIGGIWAFLGRVGLWFPTRFRDWVYAWISRNRYDLLSPFTCELPNHKRLPLPPAS